MNTNNLTWNQLLKYGSLRQRLYVVVLVVYTVVSIVMKLQLLKGHFLKTMYSLTRETVKIVEKK